MKRALIEVEECWLVNLFVLLTPLVWSVKMWQERCLSRAGVLEMVVKQCCRQPLQAAQGYNTIFAPLVLTGWPLGEAISLIYRPFSKRALTDSTSVSVIGPSTETATLIGQRSKESRSSVVWPGGRWELSWSRFIIILSGWVLALFVIDEKAVEVWSWAPRMPQSHLKDKRRRRRNRRHHRTA